MTNKTRNLSDQQHAQIFQAYLARLTVTDAEKIVGAVRKGWFAGQNLGTSSQFAAFNEMEAVILDVLGRMLDHDKQNITRIIDRATTQEAAAT